MDELIAQLDLTVQTLPFTPWYLQTWFFICLVLMLMALAGIILIITRRSAQQMTASKSPEQELEELVYSLKNTKRLDGHMADRTSRVLKRVIQLELDAPFNTYTDGEMLQFLAAHKNNNELNGDMPIESLEAAFEAIGNSRFNSESISSHEITHHLQSLNYYFQEKNKIEK